MWLAEHVQSGEDIRPHLLPIEDPYITICLDAALKLKRPALSYLEGFQAFLTGPALICDLQLPPYSFFWKIASVSAN